MAINKSNAGDVVTTEFKLYTGLINMKVVAINPATAEQIEALGYKKPNQNPEYITTDDEGVLKVRLDLYLENADHNVKTKMALWLENKERISQSGKFEYINNQAQSCFADTPDAYAWFDGSTARKATVGETTLHDFVKVWANVSTKADAAGKLPECKLEGIPAMFNGNFSELQSLVNDLSDYEVKVLLGVRTVEGEDDNGMPKVNYYQDVYTKMFARSYQKSNNPWLKKLSDEYGAYKQEYQNSLLLQEFNPNNVATPTANQEGTTTEAGGDDMPF